MDIGDDERFSRAIALFNEREFEEAADLFEELFFEAVLGEVALARTMLQFAAGAHHIERGQRRVALERLGEGLAALERIENSRGVEVARLREEVEVFIQWIEDQSSEMAIPWPSIHRE